jgi:hypothetical protein
MGQLVCTGASLLCTFGVAPSELIALPKGAPVLAGGPPAATVMDNVPIVNIPPFGMCTSPANPEVAAATAAALGVPTPMPCVPATVAPWVPGSPTVLINDVPALNNTSQCMCMWGGVITVTYPGEVTVEVP